MANLETKNYYDYGNWQRLGVTKTTVTERLFDTDGNLIKETITETVTSEPSMRYAPDYTPFQIWSG